ncbi:MAG TPA: AAA family ATPase [Archangium sp.]|uniref:AAA family ATPase n=1 Tax=Archangium sp. TaxID=1872627 RepID=UPI002E34894D|nr:AAA family ATPase [Archangium sp.]HEX5754182.1 AAA family ATPase [Archangium sp.]
MNKFRTVKPGTRLAFNPGYNVLLGQNGTGKTTLLNLVAAAIKSNFADFKDEEFDLSYELESDKATATLSVRNQNRALPISLNLKDIAFEHPQPGAWVSEGVMHSPSLSVSTSISSKKTGLHVQLDLENQRGSARRTDEAVPGPSLEFDLSLLKNFPPWVLLVTALEQWGDKTSTPRELLSDFRELFLESTTSRFDESLEYFNKLGELPLELFRYPDGHIASSGALDPTGVMNEPLGSQARGKWGAPEYLLTDANLQPLKQTLQLLDFESAEAILELVDSLKGQQIDMMRLGNLRFYFSHRGGWKISEKMLSYGQKRVLSFMFYLSTAKSTVIADELVNGLHHRWIRACFEALGPRQVFLTSQNPLLLDYLSFKSPEEVRSAFVLCRWEKGPEQMVWENMSQEAAADFFDSYKVGFQQVGELLQSKGLW